jgi:integral membrane protein (TIGR00529 family)
MYDVLKIFAIFTLIVLLIKRKINLGLSMMIGAGGLAFLYLLPLSAIGNVLVRAITNYTTVQMTAALGLIMVMENIMRKTETFKQMMESLKRVVRDTRIVLAAPPAIIGMVPSIGGAYFSAPLVEEAGSAYSITPERKGFINYWFRHIWEYVLPTYPGLILASAIIHVPLGKLILYQTPFAVMVIVSGGIFCFRGIDLNRKGPSGADTPQARKGRDLARFTASLFPILSIILLVALFHIDIAVVMVVVISLMFIYHRFPLKRIAITLRESISWNILLIIVGVMFFKETLRATGAVEGMSLFLTQTGFPLMILFFILPFLVGLLTGLTIAFVGTTFPLLITLSGGAPEIGKMAFAFASGFMGVMFSPMHLCFVLTGEYFRADRGTIYRYMLIPSGMVMLTAVAMWMV